MQDGEHEAGALFEYEMGVVCHTPLPGQPLCSCPLCPRCGHSRMAACKCSHWEEQGCSAQRSVLPTFEKEKRCMMCGAEMQWCCRPSYTKCSYVLSMTSHAPALAVRCAALSSTSLLNNTPASSAMTASKSPVVKPRDISCLSMQRKLKRMQGVCRSPASVFIRDMHAIKVYAISINVCSS